MVLSAALAPALAACAGPASPAVPPASAVDTGPLVGLVARGGLCAHGPCRSVLRVRADGSWTWTQSRDRRHGRLDPAELAALRTAVATTTLAGAPAFDGVCPTAFDGQELVYTWVADGVRRRVAGCERAVPDADPLVRAMTHLVLVTG